MLEECPVEILQLEEEFTPLVEEYRCLGKKEFALEIGAANGGSLFFWIKYAMPNQYICVIDRDVSHDTARLWRSWVEGFKSFGDINLLICKADSTQQVTINFVKENIPFLDFLFIDGENTRLDYINYAPLVREGGIIALHNIKHSIWEEIKIGRKYKEFITGSGIGILYV